MDPAPNHEKYCENLESLFSSLPSLKPSKAGKDDQDVIELHIDDVVMGGPVITDGPAPSSSIQKNKTEKKDKEQRRKDYLKARLVIHYSIYNKWGLRSDVVDYFRMSAGAAAACMRYKLAKRQEKLEKLSQNSEELRSGAVDFASMAKELAKRLETRKWWQI